MSKSESRKTPPLYVILTSSSLFKLQIHMPKEIKSKSQLRLTTKKEVVNKLEICRKILLDGGGPRIKQTAAIQQHQHISWLWLCSFSWWHGAVRYCQSNYRRLLQDKHQCILKSNCAAASGSFLHVRQQAPILAHCFLTNSGIANPFHPFFLLLLPQVIHSLGNQLLSNITQEDIGISQSWY